MGIGWGWVGRAEERPMLWVGEGIESGPLILQAEQFGIQKKWHPLVHGVGMKSV